MLIFFLLAQEYKPKTINDYNTIISAEIPDENSNYIFLIQLKGQ
jgi:hypothetical protein